MASSPPPDLRRQKRRELDARRSRCRIRLGGHLERWCRLKDQLGFSLHSQLAQFLLDRYSSHGVRSSGHPDPTFLHADALQRLVVLSHGHGQECGFVPDVKGTPTGDTSSLVWECVAGHSFSWGVPNPPGDCPPPSPPSGDPRGEDQARDPHHGSSPVATRRRSLRRGRPLGESRKGETEAEGGAPSPGGDGGQQGASCGGGDGENTTPAVPEMGTAPKANGSARDPEEKQEGGDEAQGEEEEEEEEEEEDLAYSDDLRDESYHPSLDSDSEPQRRQTQPKALKKPIKEEPPSHEPILSSSSPPEEKLGGASCRRRPPLPDEDVAQIGPKRIRKAAKRELLLCDFEGCGKIFSNRQYLNHHKKYQHVHQKTFTCSEPSCGKSFNFKKHLKEHQKLHTDTRDYICEFCARSFRTSSNLIIHRRIHTGEKPLQCEICGFTCRQKASLNWHMKKHSADTFYQFSCDICGKKFEKKDNVTAHKSKSHPQTLPGPPQLEGGQLEMVPSPNLGLTLEQPEVVEPLEVAGLGEEALGSEEEEEEEKTPQAMGTSREGPGGSPGDAGQAMDGVGS